LPSHNNIELGLPIATNCTTNRLLPLLLHFRQQQQDISAQWNRSEPFLAATKLTAVKDQGRKDLNFKLAYKIFNLSPPINAYLAF
jgi:hypothetical protein